MNDIVNINANVAIAFALTMIAFLLLMLWIQRDSRQTQKFPPQNPKNQ